MEKNFLFFRNLCNFAASNPSLTRRWFISYKEMERFAKQTGICFYTEYPLQIFKNQPVCLVYHGSVEGGEIDLRGRLRIVPHAFADD